MLSDELAIEVNGVAKSYDIDSASNATTLAEAVVGALRRTQLRDRKTLWALEDVSFQVRSGEAFGIIGRNGAGKSTLLKVLSRITRPTRGVVQIRGRVGSLLEVGTGFHPELTGRENIFLNGAILGMTRREVTRQFDAIVDFAETAAFLDVPVKRYSSGMYVRLAFAVSAHLDPDVLIVDEVLAVGDTSFQRKCLGKMGAVTREDGRTVLLVSHNLVAVTSLCSRGLLLEKGRVVSMGPIQDVAQCYLRSLEQFSSVNLSDRTDRTGSGRVRFTDLAVHGANVGAPVQSGQDVTLALSYASLDEKPLRGVHVTVEVRGVFDEPLFHLSPRFVRGDFDHLPSTGVLRCTLPRLPLQAGSYHLALAAQIGQESCDYVPHAGVLEVEGGDFYGTGLLPPAEEGAFLVEQRWTLESATAD